MNKYRDILVILVISATILIYLMLKMFLKVLPLIPSILSTGILVLFVLILYNLGGSHGRK